MGNSQIRNRLCSESSFANLLGSSLEIFSHLNGIEIAI